MSKHTPGPWTVKCLGSTRSNRAGYIDANNVHVGYAYRDKSHMHVGEAEANARLISASPDMLVALRELVAICDLYGGHSLTPDSPSIVRTRAAINKAEGSEQ